MEFVGAARGRPVRDLGDSSSRLAEKSYIFWSGRPLYSGPFQQPSCHSLQS